jgi:integrase
MSLADARELAKEKLADVQKGGDPTIEKRRALAADTFEALANRYLDEHARRHKKERSIKEDERNIRRELLPIWRNRKAREIARRDVIALVDGIAARGAEIHANRVLALISKIFNFGIAKDIVETSPAHRVPKPGKERHRDRVLNHEEVRAVWEAIEDERPITRGLFKLLLLTGQRRNEVCGMRWPEIDLDAGWWVIPGHRTKNGLAHRVPLVGETLRILQGAAQNGKGSDYVFRGRQHGKPLASPQKALARIAKRSQVDFRVHDLRRTLGTGLAGLGVDRTTIKKVLNHSEQGDVTAIYDRHGYDDEKRAALAKWDRRVREILDGTTAKVVQLRA